VSGMGRTGRRCDGFSLLEVMIAAALLLMTVTAVSAAVVGVSRAGARLQGSMDADRAVRSEAERLRALPYCAVSYPQPGAGRGASAPDLVAAVFPHAVMAQNAPSARYVSAADASGAPAGSFVTLVTRDGVVVRCVARFLAGPDGPELEPEQLAGWDLAGSDAPPAPTLSVSLSPDHGGRSVRLVRSALSAMPLVPSAALPGSG
jgi:Tfp pilus assembly protein PilV